MNHRERQRLQTLQKRINAGEEARAVRDRLLSEHFANGVQQIELAAILDEVEPGTVTRNQVQKTIQRYRQEEQ